MSIPNSRLSGFLELAPTTSNSYPQAQRPQQQPQAKPEAADANAVTTAAAADEAASSSEPKPVQRRSSSLSSSSSEGMRFLKLGPVHWGAHMEEHQGDFAIE